MPVLGNLIVILEVYADAFPDEDVAARFPVRSIPPTMYGPLTRRVRKAVGDGVPIQADESRRYVLSLPQTTVDRQSQYRSQRGGPAWGDGDPGHDGRDEVTFGASWQERTPVRGDGDA